METHIENVADISQKIDAIWGLDCPGIFYTGWI